MWRNCLLRSGLEEPSWVLRFPCKLYFCARSSFPTVVEPTMCPFSQSSLARVRVLLHVQRIPRIGSPRTVGSIRASRSERSVGSFFVTPFRPPPGFRTRPPARGCSSKCCLPRVIRGREIPVARCTMVTPPWPMDRASAAHHSRSVRSSRCGAMSAYRFSSAAIGEPMVGSVTFIHVQVLTFFSFKYDCHRPILRGRPHGDAERRVPFQHARVRMPVGIVPPGGDDGERGPHCPDERIRRGRFASVVRDEEDVGADVRARGED